MVGFPKFGQNYKETSMTLYYFIYSKNQTFGMQAKIKFTPEFEYEGYKMTTVWLPLEFHLQLN